MKISVSRFTHDSDATLSLVKIDDAFECFGLEDEPRKNKVANETRIPAGYYKIVLRDEGVMTLRYKARFPNLHHGMLHVIGVPNFTYIYLHIGNREDQTSGCLLLGQGVNTRPAMGLMRSALAYEHLYRKVVQAAIIGALFIEYLDEDLINEEVVE